MTAALVQNVASRWARLGIMLNVRPTRKAPDLERLLVDTARVAGSNSRIFVLAATWLLRYGDYVAKHRLARVVAEECEREYRPIVGFLLEWVREHGSSGRRFNMAIEACEPALDARPLSEVERRNSELARLAQRRATPLSRKWGCWHEAFAPKFEAIRPDEWVAEHNPQLYERAMTGGDLVATVLVACEESDTAPTEAELVRRCGASRPAVRQAVRRLRLAGRIRLMGRGRGMRFAVRQRWDLKRG